MTTMGEESEPITIVEIYGSQLSSCGYCTKKDGSVRPRTSHTVSMSPLQMSCSVYKRLLDRGWRRSGDYLYKPNLKESCCPQYTIKLDALNLKLSKSQRKALNKWNRFIINGDNTTITAAKNPLPLVELVHAADISVQESQGCKPAHRLEVTLEPSSYTDEKYQLYLKYQVSIHEDTGNTPNGFERFLVTSAIRQEPIPYRNTSTQPAYPLPTHYGSYHQMYRVDGQLIAIGVIDILPGCVSSVYFMYAPEWNAWSLGKVSAVREATLAKEIHDAGVESMNSLYMGFYIYSCPKMRYKGEYEPSYLLDPESYTWHPLETCITLLDKAEYSTFNESKLDKDEMSQQDMRQMQVVASIAGGTVKVAPLGNQTIWKNPRSRKQIEAVIETFGKGLRDDIILSM
ncbi:unnamed protein product [Rhizoctonia solani]|uniref:Arginyl-tRNA--protein transferase 1 n=1 Tax=Rhizoctonia solani TaxID=456999 RepID=A0A8H2XM40_9AGAM|nr:unnamed protein product [Rhizoctonia solani]CAE6467446.1 unnamed protein product [Rhizoctonia solani]